MHWWGDEQPGGASTAPRGAVPPSAELLAEFLPPKEAEPTPEEAEATGADPSAAPVTYEIPRQRREALWMQVPIFWLLALREPKKCIGRSPNLAPALVLRLQRLTIQSITTA